MNNNQSNSKSFPAKLILILISVLIIMVLLTSCSRTGSNLSELNFKQGAAELEFSYLPNIPLDELYPGSNVKIILELENQAAYDATEVEVSIVGLDENYFQFYDYKQEVEDLEGRNLFNPEGEKMFLEFTGLVRDLLPSAEQYVGDYLLKINYKSTMEFSDTVCLNPDLYEVYDTGCKVEDIKSYSGQGAPLAITEIKEIISPGGEAEVEFRITLRNRGDGKIKTIQLGSSELGGKPIFCEFKSDLDDKRVIVLDEDKQEALLFCRTNLESQNSYTTTLIFDFEYDYELKQKNKLRIINPTVK
ncbi:MAG TPA: hypothetical protein VJC39_03590 [Candidatus Nanoarchaeia archaeon]|nr:hypothetical protein [Candidatus Nanoarchaeia archaeon]